MVDLHQNYRHPDEQWHADRMYANRKVVQQKAVKAANKRTSVRPGTWPMIIKIVFVLFCLTVILGKCSKAIAQNREYCRQSRYPGKRFDHKFTAKKHSVAHFRKKENRKRTQRMRRNQFLKSFSPIRL